MMQKYRPVYIPKGAPTKILERYIENICNLHHISGELYGNIQFAVLEGRDVICKMYENLNSKGMRVKAEVEGHLISFELTLYPEIFLEQIPGRYTLDVDDLVIQRELFLLEKLADGVFFKNENPGFTLSFNCEGMRYERVMERISALKDFWSGDRKLKEVYGSDS